MDASAPAPVLVALSGLPGVGKTTIARLVVARLGAMLLRIDTVEQALVRAGEIGDRLAVSGYAAAYAVAEDNLRLGRHVVADSVNPIAVTREAWRRSAQAAGARFLPVELVCGDRAEHRRRVETRQSDIDGLILPDWPAILTRDYAAWDEAALRIDTAEMGAEVAAGLILARAGWTTPTG